MNGGNTMSTMNTSSPKQKVVLAYSGGLDTSVILKWLIEQGHDVVAGIVNVGQDENFVAAEEKARAIGASNVHVVDAREEFVRDFVFPALQANAVYEGRYLMGTSLARPVIAKHLAVIAQKEGTTVLAHGATGKGNDQVRFELAWYSMVPGVQVISPWKMDTFLSQFQGRPDMVAYAELKGIPVKATAPKIYSEDDNLLHISHEAGILEDPSKEAPEHVYSRTVAPEKAPDLAARIKIAFERGVPVRVVDEERKKNINHDPVAILTYLNTLGGEHGIGRLDMVENRYVGIKSRGVYETPGGTILQAAHRDLEGITMDREVMRIRDTLIPEIARTIYNGCWFSPEMHLLLGLVRTSQEYVSGTVTVKLYKGTAMPVARESPLSLYDAAKSSMDVAGGYDQTDAAGFIRVNAHRLTISAQRDQAYRRQETDQLLRIAGAQAAERALAKRTFEDPQWHRER